MAESPTGKTTVFLPSSLGPMGLPGLYSSTWVAVLDSLGRVHSFGLIVPIGKELASIAVQGKRGHPEVLWP